jgi:hypothetical protein
MKNLGIISSSEDSSKLGTMVSGIFIGGAVLIVMLAKWLGFEVTSDDVTNFGIALGSMLAFMVTIYGIIKKIVIALQQKLTSTPNIVTTEVVTSVPTATDTIEVTTTKKV